MPSRRTVLSLATTGTLGSIAGCASLVNAPEEPLPVALLLDNDDTEPQEVTVVITRGSGERVFETTKTVPADDGVSVRGVQFDSAFEGLPGDKFTVQAWFEEDPAGTFDYEVTCPKDNYIALLVEHRSYRDDREPIHYNDHWCAN